jgi:hypothetical protein
MSFSFHGTVYNNTDVDFSRPSTLFNQVLNFDAIFPSCLLTLDLVEPLNMHTNRFKFAHIVP